MPKATREKYAGLTILLEPLDGIISDDLTAGSRLLDVCESLHMATTGSSDTSKRDARKYREILSHALGNWEDSGSLYDNTVRMLLMVAVAEFDNGWKS